MASDDVNLKSVDAMFARLIAEQGGLKSAIMLRFDQQDKELAHIKQQAQLTNGRVNKLEHIERERKVRYATTATIFSGIGAGLGWVIDFLFRHN